MEQTLSISDKGFKGDIGARGFIYTFGPFGSSVTFVTFIKGGVYEWRLKLLHNLENLLNL